MRGVIAALTLAGCAPSPEAKVTAPGPELPTGEVATTTPEPVPCATPEDEAAAKRQAVAAFVEENYAKSTHMVPMRDGAKLFTVVYEPKHVEGPVPVLMHRTPYKADRAGEGQMPSSLGPSEQLMRAGYVFVYQDVRGRYLSEGQFVNMTPHEGLKGIDDKTPINESTDTFDTIDWVLKNVAGTNRKFGLWGISYPGFYSAAGMIDHHPALVAVSPQAPIADWWFDDFHHHGAFFLPHAFNFLASFGKPRPRPTREGNPRFRHGSPDGYGWFLRQGTLRELKDAHLGDEISFWNDLVAHPNRDEFWEARDILPHLKNVSPAVMTVGGWYDAEDLYGPLKIYRAVEANNPDVFNVLVMGPWRHGGWSRADGDHLGNAYFGAKHSVWYREEVEKVFFEHYLRGDSKAPPDLPEAFLFDTGKLSWERFGLWPTPDAEPRTLYMGADGGLGFEAPKDTKAKDTFVSDPDKPVPAFEDVSIGMTREYMTDDQRFASRRPDVLVYQTEVLEEPLTVAGPLQAKLWVSTSQRDADWVVKVIDVHPADAADHDYLARGKHMGEAQMMVRSEVFRGRFRDGYDKAVPFKPNVPDEVSFELQDVLHTFEPGHRIMIQIQSTWFPIVDRNPQGWAENIFEAKPEDFKSATHAVYRDAKHPSRVEITVLPAK